MAELETDVQQLQDELERHQVQLRDADRDKTKAISELSEQNHRLLEQLSRVSSCFLCVFMCSRLLGPYAFNRFMKSLCPVTLRLL